MPTLTIILTNYNYGHFLEEAVESIVEEVGSYEILIIDDASTDGSRDLINDLAHLYPQVRYHLKQTNTGFEDSVALGLELAKGTYIHLFSADDVYRPGALTIMLDHITRYPAVPVFCSDFTSFFHPDKKNMQIDRQLPTCHSFAYFSSKEIFHLFQRSNFWLPGHTIFVKKSVYLKYAPPDKNLRFVCDWFINHMMALEEGVGYIPKGLIAMRKHATNYSSSNNEVKREAFLYLLEKLEKKPKRYAKLAKSGIVRMIGLKTVYKDIIKKPRYWKYLIPMIKRELLKNDSFSLPNHTSI